jgi:hypothetical protein
MNQIKPPAKRTGKNPVTLTGAGIMKQIAAASARRLVDHTQ